MQGDVAAHRWPAQKARRRRAKWKVATRPRGHVATSVGRHVLRSREEKKTVNRGGHSPI